MKKLTIDRINADIFYERLDNGLMVYMYTDKNIHNNYVTFTTKYGSINNEFKIDGKNIKLPNGIAHFLEHKVFVLENDPQPEEYYGNNGSICNAYTTFKNTTYMFSGTDNVIDNTCFLLDFVGNLFLTDENVKSEKGIITQEIKMCDDRPNDILYDKIRANTIHKNPFKESIIGTVKEVNSITKEMLTKCYNTFYHPKNMFLVVTGNFDKDKMLKAIKENQLKKEFPLYNKPIMKKYNEPDTVVKEYEIVKCNTNIPKFSYNLKINIDDFDMDVRKLSIYMFMYFNLLFGDTSDFDYKMKEEEIITNTLYYNLLNIDSHFIISLINSTDKYDDLIKKIEDRFKSFKLKKDEFIRKKRVLISNEIFSYESVEMINDMIVDNIIFDNKICKSVVSIIDELDMNELEEIISKINFDNKSIVILKK